MSREHFRLIFPGLAHVLADLLRLDMYALHQAQFVKTMDLHTQAPSLSNIHNIQGSY